VGDLGRARGAHAATVDARAGHAKL
jgi:hypothetical protein